jgi:uncharacterized protein (TIGR00251 family)
VASRRAHDVDQLALDEQGGAVTLRVRAVPGSQRDRVIGQHGDALRVAVAAAPERGKANRRLLAVLAKELGLPPASLTLVSGDASRDKRVRIDGISAAELRRRIAARTAPP